MLIVDQATWWQSPALLAAAITAGGSLLVGMIALVVNSARARRDRRRGRFAEAFSAVASYWEFPYVVRRRRHDEPAGERVRISEALRSVQEQISYHEALLRIESKVVGERYRQLVAVTRAVIGPQIRDAWLAAPITSDEGMNIEAVTRDGLNVAVDAYVQAVRDHLSVVPGPFRRVGRKSK